MPSSVLSAPAGAPISRVTRSSVSSTANPRNAQHAFSAVAHAIVSPYRVERPSRLMTMRSDWSDRSALEKRAANQLLEGQEAAAHREHGQPARDLGGGIRCREDWHVGLRFGFVHRTISLYPGIDVKPARCHELNGSRTRPGTAAAEQRVDLALGLEDRKFCRFIGPWREADRPAARSPAGRASAWRRAARPASPVMASRVVASP